ncbi:hypothetical protein [Thiocystis violascens]|uniref:DUF4435 domain-containing protein n=1 Tax=Thiocystis violascens (strain ATCC 17096 / DSM 198 / 6111) TaxID=765911 RepID=I3YBP9_THIV6|nr:hypothetical protein [Thiocystis violascens]AFL74417.1 hypothetical protein Thivi_2477 [Thiocystis violascens DSM 198]
MGAFKKLKQTDKLVLKQRGGAVVFLESNDDFEIIAQRWFFNEGEDIWFQPADSYETGTGGGGCDAVIDLVNGTRADGIRAFGIVDRDILLNNQNWPLWWEPRDDVFQAARPYGSHIRVLLRWELENYLLHPDAMKIEANDSAMVSTHTADSVLASCLECSDELKNRSAATVAALAVNLSPPAIGFGCNPLVCGITLMEDLQKFLTKKGLSNAAQAMEQERQQIDRFDAPSAPARTRWEHLVRMLDGKAALKYISHRAKTRFDERRAGLANRMFERGIVPLEVREYIKEFKSAI